MRLIECYIDNFGKLADFYYSFAPGLNSICRENGFGKSTLCAFIRAMLYGLDDSHKQRLDDNERKKYEPWQGGAWGGSLTVEINGRALRIERTFAKKSADDTLKIIDTGTGIEANDYREPLGESFFGIDKDGFERTVFLSEKMLSEGCENRTVAAKLSDLSGVECDLSELDAALAILEDERRFYSKRGSRGELDAIKERIATLEAQLMSLSTLALANENDTKRLHALELEAGILRTSLDERRKNEGKIQWRAALYKKYREALENKKREHARLVSLRTFFGGREPDTDEIDAISRLAAEIERLSRELDEAIRKSTQESAGTPLPTDGELEAIKKKSEELSTLQRRREELATPLPKPEPEAPPRPVTKCRGLPLVLAILFLIAGIALGITVEPYLFAVALIAFIMLPFSFRKYIPERNEMSAEERWQASEGERVSHLAELDARIAALTSQIRTDMAKYGLAGENVSTLMQAVWQRRHALETVAAAISAKRHELEEAKKLYAQYLSHYPTESSRPLEEIKRLKGEYEVSVKFYKRYSDECASSEAENGFTEGEAIEPEAAHDTAADEARLRELDAEIASLAAKCRKDEHSLEEAEIISSEIELLTEKGEGYSHRLSILKKTKEYLSLAKDNLNSRYLGRAKAAFERYVSMIVGRDEHFTLDTSFIMSKHEGGQSKPRDAYSRGTRELYGFALRLAIIDALYETDTPPIVIDDVFAYFDDEKLEKAKELLSAIAEERQIIYLTSSTERNI